MSVPSFIVGGAPRSGTTWLYRLLDLHPEVCMAAPAVPEPKFFLNDELYARGMDFYLSTWFHGVEEGRVCGEKSTNYLESPVAAERIARHLPDARLVFILREPCDRAFNNWLWSRMNGKESEDFETALDLEDERERACPPELRYARPHDLFHRGLYARHLTRFYERFPREHVLCLRFEDLPRDPGGVAARLHRFLGVTERPGDGRSLGVVNRAVGERRETIPPAALERLRQAYAEPNRELAELLGNDFEVW